MIEDVVRRVERERGAEQDSSWRHNESNGYRYLPWSGLWMHETGLLLALNYRLAAHGMQMVEVFEDPAPGRPEPVSVGFDIEGDGIGPFPPDTWNDPDVLKSFWRLSETLKPRVPLDYDEGIRQFHG